MIIPDSILHIVHSGERALVFFATPYLRDTRTNAISTKLANSETRAAKTGDHVKRCHKTVMEGSTPPPIWKCSLNIHDDTSAQAATGGETQHRSELLKDATETIAPDRILESAS